MLSIFIIYIVFLVTVCSNKSQVHDNTTINVVCTTSMITDAVKHIGGKQVTVNGLMGPGVDPHLYRARESDVHKLAGADIIFYNGLHLEGKITEILRKMNSWVHTVAVADSIPKVQLLESDFVGIYDPHIWHDVSLWIPIVECICDNLITVDPKHKKEYIKRANLYTDALKKLDQYVKTHTQTIPPAQRILVTAHDAFAYFGRAYGFKVVGLQGISTDAEIGTKDIQQLVDYIVQNKIRALFFESSVPQRNIEVVQKAVISRGWNIMIGQELFSDALGDDNTSAHTYIGMIQHNINAIVAALS